MTKYDTPHVKLRKKTNASSAPYKKKLVNKVKKYYAVQ